MLQTYKVFLDLFLAECGRLGALSFADLDQGLRDSFADLVHGVFAVFAKVETFATMAGRRIMLDRVVEHSVQIGH